MGDSLREEGGVARRGGDSFKVIGSGAVYVVDGSDISYSNVAEAQSLQALSMHNMRVHVLSDHDSFDLKERRAIPPPPRHRRRD